MPWNTGSPAASLPVLCAFEYSSLHLLLGSCFTPQGLRQFREIEGSLRAAGLIGHFEFIQDSALTGRRKPNAESYERAARALGLPLRTCWYVSDTTYDFHRGALALGLGAAIVFDPRSVWLPKPGETLGW